jgi:hypothetical protein
MSKSLSPDLFRLLSRVQLYLQFNFLLLHPRKMQIERDLQIGPTSFSRTWPCLKCRRRRRNQGLIEVFPSYLLFMRIFEAFVEAGFLLLNFLPYLCFFSGRNEMNHSYV